MNRTVRTWLSLGLAVVFVLSLRLQMPCHGRDKASDVPQGVIESVKKPDGKDPAILLCLVGSINQKGYPFGDGNALVGITEKTKLEKVVDGKRQPAKLEDLKKGAKIEFSGYDEILESAPPLMYPKSVVILKAKE